MLIASLRTTNENVRVCMAGNFQTGKTNVVFRNVLCSVRLRGLSFKKFIFEISVNSRFLKNQSFNKILAIGCRQ